MKTYDRDKVLSVSAQLVAAVLRHPEAPIKLDLAVHMAKDLIDEVERQCPMPGRPKPTIAPGGWTMNAARLRKELDESRANFATADRMLTERTRERDEARTDCNHNRDLLGKELARGRILEKERDAAREQLAKLEWAGPWRNAAPELPGYDRGPAAPTCIECRGVKPEKRILGSFPDADIGHRPTCWFAKKDKQVTIPAGALKVGDVVTLRVSFRPDGAPGYAVSMKSEPVDTTKDAVLSMTATKSEPARPEPRFKVGERVTSKVTTLTSAGFKEGIKEPWIISRRSWVDKGGGPQWWYEGKTDEYMCYAEAGLFPAPKFAVGEWVDFPLSTGEITSIDWTGYTWLYRIRCAEGQTASATENMTTAQKHGNCARRIKLHLARDRRSPPPGGRAGAG